MEKSVDTAALPIFSAIRETFEKEISGHTRR